MRHALCLLPLLVLPLACASTGGHARSAHEPAAFTTLRSLAGKWTGTAHHGDGQQMPAEVEYRVVAAGSAVEQRQFPGTEHEMVTLYHLDGDDVVMTHYCAAGNQPRMKLVDCDPHHLHFAFAGGTNMTNSDHHMHDVLIKLVGPDRLEELWSSYNEGKPAESAQFELGRLQSIGYAK